MNNPYHTHTTELDITCAGQTKTHELRVMYTYTAAIPVFCMDGSPIDTAAPAQVEIHQISEVVNKKDPGYQCTSYEIKTTKYSEIAWEEHIEAIEQEILEGME